MNHDSKKANNWSIFGSLGVALAAAVCCLGPLVLVSLGVTGAWIGNLSAFEPYRPLFMVVAAVLLGFGFYRVYGRPGPGQPAQEDCGEGAGCEVPKSNRINQVSLWIATVVVVGLFASPFLLGVGVGGTSAEQPTAVGAVEGSEKSADQGHADEGDSAKVTLTVQKMTCGGCAGSVQTALARLDGVEGAQVTFEPPQAVVTYDPSKVSVEKLTKATAEIGYPSIPQS